MILGSDQVELEFERYVRANVNDSDPPSFVYTDGSATGLEWNGLIDVCVVPRI